MEPRTRTGRSERDCPPGSPRARPPLVFALMALNFGDVPALEEKTAVTVTQHKRALRLYSRRGTSLAMVPRSTLSYMSALSPNSRYPRGEVLCTKAGRQSSLSFRQPAPKTNRSVAEHCRVGNSCAQSGRVPQRTAATTADCFRNGGFRIGSFRRKIPGAARTGFLVLH